MTKVYMITWAWVGPCSDPWEHQEWGFYTTPKNAISAMKKLIDKYKDSRSVYEVVELSFEKIDDERAIIQDLYVFKLDEIKLIEDDSLVELKTYFDDFRYEGDSVALSSRMGESNE